MLKHVVVYRFGSEASEETIKQIFALLSEAYQKIPGMSAFSHGKSTGEVLLSRNFSHCFVMDFKDKKSLKEYIDHQNHLEVRRKVRELVKSEEDIFEFDYEY